MRMFAKILGKMVLPMFISALLLGLLPGCSAPEQHPNSNSRVTEKATQTIPPGPGLNQPDSTSKAGVAAQKTKKIPKPQQSPSDEDEEEDFGC